MSIPKSFLFIILLFLIKQQQSHAITFRKQIDNSGNTLKPFSNYDSLRIKQLLRKSLDLNSSLIPIQEIFYTLSSFSLLYNKHDKSNEAGKLFTKLETDSLCQNIFENISHQSNMKLDKISYIFRILNMKKKNENQNFILKCSDKILETITSFFMEKKIELEKLLLNAFVHGSLIDMFYASSIITNNLEDRSSKVIDVKSAKLQESISDMLTHRLQSLLHSDNLFFKSNSKNKKGTAFNNGLIMNLLVMLYEDNSLSSTLKQDAYNLMSKFWENMDLFLENGRVDDHRFYGDYMDFGLHDSPSTNMLISTSLILNGIENIWSLIKQKNSQKNLYQWPDKDDLQKFANFFLSAKHVTQTNSIYYLLKALNSLKKHQIIYLKTADKYNEKKEENNVIKLKLVDSMGNKILNIDGCLRIELAKLEATTVSDSDSSLKTNLVKTSNLHSWKFCDSIDQFIEIDLKKFLELESVDDKLIDRTLSQKFIFRIVDNKNYALGNNVFEWKTKFQIENMHANFFTYKVSDGPSSVDKDKQFFLEYPQLLNETIDIDSQNNFILKFGQGYSPSSEYIRKTVQKSVFVILSPLEGNEVPIYIKPSLKIAERKANLAENEFNTDANTQANQAGNVYLGDKLEFSLKLSINSKHFINVINGRWKLKIVAGNILFDNSLIWNLIDGNLNIIANSELLSEEDDKEKSNDRSETDSENFDVWTQREKREIFWTFSELPKDKLTTINFLIVALVFLVVFIMMIMYFKLSLIDFKIFIYAFPFGVCFFATIIWLIYYWLYLNLFECLRVFGFLLVLLYFTGYIVLKKRALISVGKN